VFTDGTGKKFYTRPTRLLPGADKPVEFILIPKTSRNDPPETYYIMENKVSVGLFRQFAVEHSLSWKASSQSKDDQFPALGVSVADAHRFASELLQGFLPTTDQWDKAAGFYLEKDKRVGDGPFKGKWTSQLKPQIALSTPMPVGQAS